MHQTNFDLTLDQITKIEGHASLTLNVVNGVVKKCTFEIPEYKRFYTQAVRGKKIQAIPQMVARICGTCSNAHLLCSIMAIENALDIKPSKQTYLLRRLLNNGLMIRDHALHLYVFVLPDLFNKDSILAFDESNTIEHELLHDAFAVKEAGNLLAKWSGGRSVHAPYPTVGGFMTLPKNSEKETLILKMELIRDKVIKLIRIFHDCKYELLENILFSALQDSNYDFLGKTIITAQNSCVPANLYINHLEHVVKPYSQASAYKFQGKIYIVGALSRMNLSKKNLNLKTQKDVHFALEKFPSTNIFHNNLAQAIEILHCLDDSIEILKSLEIQEEKPIPYKFNASMGIGVIEAPRGTLYHRYQIDQEGTVIKGDIIVPTGQNQLAIEKSLWDFANSNLALPKEKIAYEMEKIVRAYDPCMSCASHFLKLKIINN